RRPPRYPASPRARQARDDSALYPRRRQHDPRRYQPLGPARREPGEATAARLTMGRPPGHSPGAADIFRTHGSAWCRANAGHVSLGQLKVMSAIETCRTAALGGHVERCNDCAHVEIAYNSCRNRHCPKCQGAAARQWLEAQRDDLLPVAYYHLVFTLPAPIGAIAFHNKTVVYDLLFRAAAETLIAIAANPKHLGARVGFTAVLHTWGSALTHHPHVHMIVPGGGLSSDGSRWTACKPRFFLPVRALSRLFRRLFLEGLAALHQAGRLAFFGDLVPLADRRPLTAALAPLRRTEWVVYAKRPFAGPAAVLAYLSGYTHRVAISNSRLIASDDHSVTFPWKDYRARGEAPGSTGINAMTLPVDEFIRRFLIHVLPTASPAFAPTACSPAPDAPPTPTSANCSPTPMMPRNRLATPAWASQTPPAPISRTRSQSPRYAPVAADASVVETFARGALPRSFKADAARIDT